MRTMMITPEQIPDEVVEAFVDAYYAKDMTRKAAISAAIAALKEKKND
jgi:ribonuclease PH